MQKILAIIIPTYNMEKYLDRCLTSLIVEDEKMDRLEVLVVIDGSKDRSSEIAHTFEARYPQTFRVIDKENGNYGSCVNRGLTEATGKYIKVLDADDYFDTTVFSEYIAFLEGADADFIFNGMSMVDEDGSITGVYCFENVLGGSSVMPIEDYSAKMDGIGLYMQNVAYKTVRLKEMGYTQTEGVSYTDQEWLFTPLFVMQSVSYFTKSLYQYLVGRNGQTVDPKVHMKNMWMEIAVTKSLIKTYAERIGGVSNYTVASYIKGRLMSRIRFIYVSYLLSNRNDLNRNDLIAFDKYLLETAPDIYEMSNGLSAKFGIKYVKKWRQNHSDRALWAILVNLKHYFVK